MPRGLSAGEGSALYPLSLGDPPDTSEQGSTGPGLRFEPVPDHCLDGALSGVWRSSEAAAVVTRAGDDPAWTRQRQRQ